MGGRVALLLERPSHQHSLVALVADPEFRTSRRHRVRSALPFRDWWHVGEAAV